MPVSALGFSFPFDTIYLFFLYEGHIHLLKDEIRNEVSEAMSFCGEIIIYGIYILRSSI